MILFLGLGPPAAASAVEPDFERSCARYASDGVRVAECVDKLRLARDAAAKCDGSMQGHNLFQAWPSDFHLTPQPWHYDLHVWLWEPNPAGIFAQYNRRVSCKRGPAAGDDGEDEAGAPSAAQPRKARLPLFVLPRETRAGRRTRFGFLERWPAR